MIPVNDPYQHPEESSNVSPGLAQVYYYNGALLDLSQAIACSRGQRGQPVMCQVRPPETSPVGGRPGGEVHLLDSGKCQDAPTVTLNPS